MNPSESDDPALDAGLAAAFASDGTGAYQSLGETADAVGAIIAGKYKLLELIGEGGMGSVWMAQQTEPVKRLVAVKLIKTGMDSKAVLARFEAERQALAVMDHPNIAKILDGGVTGEPGASATGVSERKKTPVANAPGSPFFVMELVKGVPITKYCDERRLTPRQRLELFVPVCQAIQHAHQKGIIHRDIKPSNVMVALYDDKPVPKVIDFGVAKATGQSLTEETLHTGFGGVVGTPEYMSPEQATLNNLDIDTRSDIYSLGVLLYELLAGSPPFKHKDLEKAGLLEMLRVIREDEPPRPSTKLSTADALPSLSASRGTEPKKLTGLLRNELDWIVMKALEKDRSRRYETANGFAADINRYLAGEPVNAHPPSAAYRLKKFLRKNKGPVIAASLVGFALIAGIIGTSIGMVWANREREAAIDARNAEAEQRRIADEEKRRAEKAEDDTLADYRASTDDAIEQLIGSKPELGPQERAYLENTLKRWQAFANRVGDDQRSRAIRGEAYFCVGLLWHQLGRMEEARSEYASARQIYKSLVEQFPGVLQYQQNLGQTHNNLALLLTNLGQNKEALIEHQLARSIQIALVEKLPFTNSYQQDLATTHHNLAHVLDELGRLEEALRECQSAQKTQAILVKLPHATVANHRSLALTHNNLGMLFERLVEPGKAYAEYQSARKILQRLVERFPMAPLYQHELAATQNNLGILLTDLGHRTEGRNELTASRDTLIKLIEQYPAVPRYRVGLARSLLNLADRLKDVQQLEQATAQYQSVREIQERLVAQFPTIPAYRHELARARLNLGLLLADLGKHENALTEFQAVCDIEKRLSEQFPAMPAYRREVSASRYCMGNVLKKLGKDQEARVEYLDARNIKAKLVEDFPAVPVYQKELAGAHYNLGILLQSLANREEARAEYELARGIQMKLVQQYPTVANARHELASTQNNLGLLLFELREYQSALAEYQAACSIRKKLVEQFPARVEYREGLAHTHNNLGILFSKLGHREESRAAYRLAIDCQTTLAEQFPAESKYQVSVGGACVNYGNLLRDEDKPADSLEWFDRAVRTLQPVHDREPGNRTARQFLRNSHSGRARSNDAMKKSAEAIQDWNRAVELSPASEQSLYRACRANSHILAGNIAEGIAEVEDMTKSGSQNAQHWFYCACVYAEASGKDAAKKDEHAARAMELLHKAVNLGYKDAAEMASETDLESLRKRDDFKKLLSELEKKYPPK